jgi:hypothetical protein
MWALSELLEILEHLEEMASMDSQDRMVHKDSKAPPALRVNRDHKAPLDRGEMMGKMAILDSVVFKDLRVLTATPARMVCREKEEVQDLLVRLDSRVPRDQLGRREPTDKRVRRAPVEMMAHLVPQDLTGSGDQ